MKKLVAVIFGALIVQTPFFRRNRPATVQFSLNSNTKKMTVTGFFLQSTKMFLLTAKKATTHLL